MSDIFDKMAEELDCAWHPNGIEEPTAAAYLREKFGPLLKASQDWLEHLRVARHGAYLDGVPGPLMDAVDALEDD